VSVRGVRVSTSSDATGKPRLVRRWLAIREGNDDADNAVDVLVTEDEQVLAGVARLLMRRLGITAAEVRALRPVPGRSGGDEGAQ
jgi:hypothetical protein